VIAEGAIIRSAENRDSAAIACIHVEAWRDAYADLMPANYLAQLDPKIEAARWARSLGIGQNDRTLVAEVEGKVVGYASIGAARGHAPGAGEIYALYVETDWREQGIGRAIVETAFTRFRQRGLTTAFIWCLEGNTAARGFYLRCAGKLLGERRLESVRGISLPVVGFRWNL
jgi:ribosomal protein S18 acetylase RimI-like enzyme